MSHAQGNINRHGTYIHLHHFHTTQLSGLMMRVEWREVIYLESLMCDLAAQVMADSLLQAEHNLTFTRGAPPSDSSEARNRRPVAGNQF